MIKKILFVSVALTLAMSSMMSMSLPVAAATIVNGDLVTVSGNSAVYLIEGSTKRVFPHFNVYLSWGYPSDFSTVKTVTASDLASYTDGTAVPFRDGSMFRGTTTSLTGYEASAVFYVADGKLRAVKSSEIYQALFNDPTWKYVTWVPNDLLSKFNYGTGAILDSSATYPNGALLRDSSTGGIYLIAGGKTRSFASWTAYTANRYDKSQDIVPYYNVATSVISAYTAGTSVTASESALVTPGVGAEGSGSTTTGTGLTVALSSTTPASATVVANAARVPFTKVNLTASSDGEIKAQLRVERTGLSSDDNFSYVVFIDDTTNQQLGNAKTLSSSNHRTISDSITVPAGTTKTVTIAGNMAAAPNSGEIAGLDVVEVVTTATVNATLPINGNKMTMNSSIAIGTVTINRGAADPNLGGTATTKEIGTESLELIAAKILINSTEAYKIEGIEFTNYNGTANDSDLAKLKLYVDDVAYADGTISDGKVYFDLRTNAVTIDKGKNKEFMLKGDIADGSDRTLDFDIYDQVDIIAKGQTYGYYRLPTYTIGGTTSTAEPYFNAGNTYTIGVGTLSVANSNTVPVQNIAEGGDNIALGSWTLTAKGEPIKISKIRFNFNFATSTVVANYGSTTALTNVALYDSKGAMVTSMTDMTLTTASGQPDGYISFTDTWTVPKGDSTYTIKGDLGTVCENGDTLQADIDLSSTSYYTIKGENTNKTATPSPLNTVAANLQTIKAGWLQITTSSQNPPSGSSIVKGAGTSAVLAEVRYDASNSGENIKITKIRINDNPEGGAKAQYVDSPKLYNKATGAEIVPDSYPDFDSTTANANDYVDFNLTANPLIIPKGSSVDVLVKGVINSSETATYTHSFANATSSGATARGVDTGETVTPTYSGNFDGNALTVQTNAAVTATISSATPASKLIIAGTTDQEVSKFKFTTQYENATLERIEIQFTGSTASSSANDLTKVTLWDGANKIAEGSATGTTIQFRNLSQVTNKFYVKTTETQGRELTVKVNVSSIGLEQSGHPGYQIGYKITAAGDLEFKGDTSGSATESIGTGVTVPTGSTHYMRKSSPTVAVIALSNTNLQSTGDRDIYKLSVTANSAGAISWSRMTFRIGMSQTIAATNYYLYEYLNSDFSGVATDLQSVSGKVDSRAATATDTADNLTMRGDNAAQGMEEREIGAGQTRYYLLKANITGQSTTGEWFSTALVGDESQIYGPLTSDEVIAKSSDYDNFVWSDETGYNGTTYTTHATTTVDWFSGYLVPGLSASNTVSTLTY